MIVVVLGQLRLANEENTPQIPSVPQQQMEPKYSFWGRINDQQFCSLTYPAKTAEKPEGSVTQDRVPSVVHFEMKTG